jgi:hypothetical protein
MPMGFMKYAAEMASSGMRYVLISKFHEGWYRRSSNVSAFPQKFERL